MHKFSNLTDQKALLLHFVVGESNDYELLDVFMLFLMMSHTIKVMSDVVVRPKRTAIFIEI